MVPGDEKPAIDDGIANASREATDGAGRRIRAIDDDAVRAISEQWSVPVWDIYIAALRQGIYPSRYIRNRDSINIDEQISLAAARVAIAGAGGLGGHVIQLLARIGVGRLVVADYDVFDETNLNRQALSSNDTVGQSKTSAVAAHVARINCGVELTCIREKITKNNADAIVRGCDVAVDALDNIGDRFILEASCKRQGIPLVHGALAGFEGTIMTIYPGDAGLKLIYGTTNDEEKGERGAEGILGVPSLTPAVIASFQAMEVVKIILDRGEPFRNMMVYVDVEGGAMERFLF